MRIECISAPSLRPALLPALLLAATLLHGQTPKLELDHPQPQTLPTVTFSFNWPSVEPHRYVISVDSGGNAAYRSWMAEPTAEQHIEGEPYMLKFTVSAAARDRIFALARQLNYFNGDFEYRKHRIASTGEKTLAYADPDKQYQTRYNWSENRGIDELTRLFQGMSTTIESGRRLERLRRFDRLGLEEELKNLEHLTVEGRATEVQVIAPTLEQVADDSGVMNIARQRARHILQLAGGSPAAGAPASSR
jgi:hypothetical protein